MASKNTGSSKRFQRKDEPSTGKGTPSPMTNRTEAQADLLSESHTEITRDTVRAWIAEMVDEREQQIREAMKTSGGEVERLQRIFSAILDVRGEAIAEQFEQLSERINAVDEFSTRMITQLGENVRAVVAIGNQLADYIDEQTALKAAL